MNNEIKEQLNSVPSLPGVYFFKNSKEQIIYIGKSANLKVRVKSYFKSSREALGHVKALMIPEIVKIDFKVADSEIDALILESQFIKKYLPKYNVLLKDDKNYFFVVFTEDEFPKIYITHQPDKIAVSKKILGPYTEGQALKITLRYLRKIFPYCTCKSDHKNRCLKAHLGLCLGICCAKDRSRYDGGLKKTYKKNIDSLIGILSGKRTNILKALEKDMKAASRTEDFEKAAKIRDQINGLKNVFEHKVFRYFEYMKKSGFDAEAIKNELGKTFGTDIQRIEFYDISNIQGELATGSMVVFDGEAMNKNEYRKFKIKSVKGPNDPAMMEEVLQRRFSRASEGSKDWQLPDLIVVDGGITQLAAAGKILASAGLSKKIRCASLAKREERLYLSPIKSFLLSELSKNTELFLRQMRDEAHRFAIGYHKKLRQKKLKEEFLKK